MICACILFYLLFNEEDCIERYIKMIVAWVFSCYVSTEALSMVEAVTRIGIGGFWIGIDILVLLGVVWKYRKYRRRYDMFQQKRYSIGSRWKYLNLSWHF